MNKYIDISCIDLELNKSEKIVELEVYAHKNNVPIIQNEGLKVLLNLIENNKIKKILEIGTAIGYSAIMMANVNEDIIVHSIERNQEMYNQAIKNIKDFNKEKQIKVFFGDALLLDNNLFDSDYDLIFIDAAKAQYQKFFEKYQVLLKNNGFIFSDNLLFHGLVEEKGEIASKNLRSLVKKIRLFNDYLKGLDNYDTYFLRVGDGIAISVKK